VGDSAMKPKRRSKYETPNMMMSGMRQRKMNNKATKKGFAVALSMITSWEFLGWRAVPGENRKAMILSIH
jgi:hypothetical protein